MSNSSVQRAKEYYGIDLQWYDIEDREAVRDHHGQLFEQRYGDRTFRKIPGIENGLQNLIDAGYSYQDISVMIGVPRHYVYRWCKWLGVDVTTKAVGGASPRVWSEDEQRFVAVDRERYLDGLVAGHQEERRREKKRRQVAQRYEHVRAVQDFVRTHGRVPNTRELAEIIGTQLPSICYYWGYKHGRRDTAHPVKRTSYAGALDALYRAAGYTR